MLENKHLNDNENDQYDDVIQTIIDNNEGWNDNIPSDESDLSWFETSTIKELIEWMSDEINIYYENIDEYDEPDDDELEQYKQATKFLENLYTRIKNELTNNVQTFKYYGFNDKKEFDELSQVMESYDWITIK